MALKEKNELQQQTKPEASSSLAQPNSDATQQLQAKGESKTESTLKVRAKTAIAFAKRKSQSAGIGDFLYDMGFWGEYAALRTAKRSKQVVFSIGGFFGGIFKKVGGFLGGMLLTGLKEITAPFVRIGRGVVHIAQHMHAVRKEQGILPALKEGACYFGRGTKRYFPLLHQSFAYVLPLFAVALLVHTVQTVLDYNYILAVEVNGAVVGYVETEQVFDSAKNELTQRVQTVGGEEREWNIAPTYSLAVSDDLMDQTEMADAILLNSAEQIQEATALYVNQELVAVTTQGQDLQTLLDDMKAPYIDPANENLRVEFSKDVQLVDGIYFTDSISDYDEIVTTLEGDEQAQIDYVVQKGDTPSGIASSFGITTAELAANNPQQDILKDLHIGDNLLVSRAQSFLDVRRIETVTFEESIGFKTVTEKSADLAFGQTKTTQTGENGIDEVTQERVYYGDADTPSEVREINRVTLKAPVDKIQLQGTKLPSGAVAQTGSGSLMWPVPNYKYVSRWMGSGHNGADICASYGAAILASDSGVVTTAGWHYSYGNYVVINHGNGFSTLYAHASALMVSAGQSVSQGQLIAAVGSTGNSTGNHCHFEVYINGVRVSARNYFGGF